VTAVSASRLLSRDGVSTFAVTAEQLTIHKHPNADGLELAQVGLYRAVVPKGVYQTGDWALYIPEQAILPDSLIEELGLFGRLASKQKNRVKAIRLRGEMSQGIVCRPSTFANVNLANYQGKDFAGLLGITKWVPEIPTHMAGVMITAPELMNWIDIENIKRYPTMFAPGEPVVATEKIHGTCCLVTVTAEGEVFVSSKGNGSKGLAIVESETNLYWRAVREYRIAEIAANILTFTGAARVGIFGEVYGKGVQDLGYGANAGVVPGYAAFDIAVDMPGTGLHWISTHERDELAVTFRLPQVPVLYDGPYDQETLLKLAEGPTVLGNGSNIREGLVVRAKFERRSDVTGSRAIAKFISDGYLTRKGAVTEYE
jgi:RNA ligase (TIGR02306 family)